MTTRSLCRTLLLLLLALPLILVRSPQAHALVRHPILFVHGWNGSAANWNTMVGRFKQDGWTDQELHTWTYDSSRSNASIAEEIKTRVANIRATTGATKVDIITHSMGGLSSRYYLKNLGGDVHVDGWVSLGGPNHGTTAANSCTTTSCVEMRQGSQFLTALNAVDETPGISRYATWWSKCDTIIRPQESTILSGALNTQTTCLSHTALLSDLAVYRQVRDWVNR